MSVKVNVKYIGVVPFPGHSFEIMFSEKNTFFSENQGKNPMYLVKEILEQKGIRLIDAAKGDSPAKFDLILYFGNINIQILSKFRDVVNVYFALEPPAVDVTHEKNNLLQLKKYFDYIVTWNDDLIDKETFIKFNYIVDFFNYMNHVPFENKKLLTNISGNKKSNHKDELYSKRLDVINYFETLEQEDFEFWGSGWDKKIYKNYRGTASSKIDVYKNFKYAICFENQRKLNGYITEKILDCFVCGIVPIYWGAENIEQYVPKECYIDYRDYENIEALISFLKNISKEQYYDYINNIKCFLNSERIAGFKPEAFANIIIGLMDRKKTIQITSAKIVSLKLMTSRMRIGNYLQVYGYCGLSIKLMNSVKTKITGGFIKREE